MYFYALWNIKMESALLIIISLIRTMFQFAKTSEQIIDRLLESREREDKLPQITVRTIKETAVAICNRETYLYTDRQTRVTRMDLEGQRYKDSPNDYVSFIKHNFVDLFFI